MLIKNKMNNSRIIDNKSRLPATMLNDKSNTVYNLIIKSLENPKLPTVVQKSV